MEKEDKNQEIKENKEMNEEIKIDEKEKIVQDKKIKKEKKQNNTTVILVVSILLSFVCGCVGAYLICQTVSVKSVVKNITTSELIENSISSSVDKVYGSTVVVVASSKGKQISTGTGFIYKKDKNNAYIMTNNHVIEGADTVEVEFNDKR